jgi:hypothetical protein
MLRWLTTQTHRGTTDTVSHLHNSGSDGPSSIRRSRDLGSVDSTSGQQHDITDLQRSLGSYSHDPTGTWRSTGDGTYQRRQSDRTTQLHRHSSNIQRSYDSDTRSQSRAGEWRSDGARYYQQVRGRLRSFRRGSKRYKQKIKPSADVVV